MKRAHGNSGLTLVELTIALGLLALAMLLLVQVFDRALATWRTAETRRSVMEAAVVAAELVTDDLRGVESGPRGDFLLEWVAFDTDGDGVRETKWPRLRLVRQASAADVARVQRDLLLERDPKAAQLGSEAATYERASPSQLEIVWLVAPASITDRDARSTGILWRGERLVTDARSKSFFANDFFGSSNLPPAGSTFEVTGGVLWLSIVCASQATDLEDGWVLARDASAAAPSWDAWSKDRPNPAVHPWNERHPALPTARGRPVLPRRVRVEVEIERPIDRLRRTRTLEAVDNQVTVLLVDDGDRVPAEVGRHVLVDAEWMKLTSVDGRRLVVERGQRGTTPAPHAAGALVHWGLAMTTEVTIPAHRTEWER